MPACNIVTWKPCMRLPDRPKNISVIEWIYHSVAIFVLMEIENAMSNPVQRVAHRGGSALAPENTLAAFRNALNFPVDAIELDVHMSRDGQPIEIGRAHV